MKPFTFKLSVQLSPDQWDYSNLITITPQMWLQGQEDTWHTQPSSLMRGLPGKQVGEVAARTITILEHTVTYLTHWYFLLLHKADPGDLGTITYPLSYLHLGLNPDSMGRKISEEGQDREFPFPLLPNLRYTSSPSVLTEETFIFCRFWNYYLVIVSEVCLILQKITLYCHKRLFLLD